jgi:3-deoxy-D-manno-octulosonic-acid transferase
MFMHTPNAVIVGPDFIAQADVQQMHITQQALLQVCMKTVVSSFVKEWNAQLW